MVAVSEGFNVPDQAGLPNFTDDSGSFVVLAGQARTTATGGVSRHNTPMGTDQHFVEAELHPLNTTARPGLVVRKDPASETYYGVWARQQTSATFRLVKLVAGVETTLATTAAPVWAIGAVLRLEVEGTTSTVLTAYLDGVQVVTATDASSPLTGGTGVGLYNAVGDARWDNFSAADLGAPPAPTWHIWNGTAESPLSLDGEWNGSGITPVTFDFITP